MPRRRQPEERSYRVLLACGDTVLLRTSPMHRATLYACTANAGHGYQVPWVSWSEQRGDYTMTKTNDDPPPWSGRKEP